MSLTAKDPNSDFNAGQTNPRTGTSNIGGLVDVQAVDLGGGCGALLTIAATRTASTVAAVTTSGQLLAANLQRVAASVLNNETVKKIYLGYNGAAAVVGTNPVGPGQAFAVPSQYAAGQINVIWDTGGTVAASVLATTA